MRHLLKVLLCVSLAGLLSACELVRYDACDAAAEAEMRAAEAKARAEAAQAKQKGAKAPANAQTQQVAPTAQPDSGASEKASRVIAPITSY